MSGHLLWRLRQGELVRCANVAVVLIGTNDLGYAARTASNSGRSSRQAIEEAEGKARDTMEDVVDYLHQECPEMAVALVGILPRGQEVKKDGQLYVQPSDFSDTIDALNAYFSQYAVTNTWLSYVDCSDRFLRISNGVIVGLEMSLMPDGLHPSQDGAAVLAGCIEEHLHGFG